MKRIFAIIMVIGLVGGAAFARGNNEETNGNRQGTGMQVETEAVTISGTVSEIDGQVVLLSGSDVYSLSAPGFYRAGVEIPYGETIEVSGTLNDENCDDCDLNADGHIWVENAMVNGEELAFDNGRSSNGRDSDDDTRGMGRKADDNQGNSGRKTDNRQSSSGRSNSSRNGRSGGRQGDDSDWTPRTGRWNNPEA